MVAEQLLCSSAHTPLSPNQTSHAMAREPSEREHAWGEALGRLRTLRQEEEAGDTLDPAPSGGPEEVEPAVDAMSPKTNSSTSDNGATPSRRDVDRAKSRPIRMHVGTSSDNHVRQQS